LAAQIAVRRLQWAVPGSDHTHAVRVAAGLVVPGVALLIAGRPELICYAVFGSFAGMYGRGEPPRLRVRHQAQAAILLLAGVGIGSVLSRGHAAPAALVAVAVLFAAAGSVVSDRCGLTPQGPFFGIFALGAIAMVPAGHATPVMALLICGSTAALSISLASVRGRRGGCEVAASPPDEMIVHAARHGLAIAMAGGTGLLLGVEHANWAMAAAAVPLAASDARGSHSIAGVLHRGLHRVIGTFVGLAVTAVLLLPGFSPTTLVIIVIVLLFPTELFMNRSYGLALGFFTPLIMLMTELADPAEPVTLLTARAVDTVIGVTIGIAVAMTVRRRRNATRDPRWRACPPLPAGTP
jgi:Fusaric acid resistance protein-like